MDDNSKQIDRNIRANFAEHTKHAAHNFLDLTWSEVNAIKLLWKLRQTPASLKTHQDVMEWHLRANGELKQHESVGRSRHHISPKKIYSKLRNRHNVDPSMCHRVATMTLPHGKAVAKVIAGDPPGGLAEGGKVGGFKVVQSDQHQVVYGADKDGICKSAFPGPQKI